MGGLQEAEAQAVDAWQIGMRTTSGSGSADSAFSSVEILEESFSEPWLNGAFTSLERSCFCLQRILQLLQSTILVLRSWV